MESKKINQLATELSPVLSDLTIIGDPSTGISKKITLSQMASLFTGTVEEYPNLASFPLVGTADTIYIALDTNVLYRWDTGLTSYVELSPNIINSLVFNDANGFDGTINLVGSVATLTITTALTQGSVPFIGTSGALTQDNANLFFDDTNNRLGINTNSPTTALDVFGSGIIGRVNGTSTNNAFLGFASAGTNRWSIGNVQSDHRFRIYNEATTSELVSVLSTGEFGIGIANPTTKVHIDGGASALIANLDANVSIAKSLSFRSDNSARFNIEVSGTESGSNAGANLFVRRYSDAGSLIDTPLTIERSTGIATFSSTVVIGSGTSNKDLTIYGATGVGIEIYETTSGTGKRLQLTQDSTSTIYNATFGSGTNQHVFQIGGANILTIDGTNSTFTNNLIAASLRTKGGLFLEASNSINSWSIYTFTDNSFRMNYNGVGNDEFIINSDGNASFSNRLSAGTLIANGTSLTSGANTTLINNSGSSVSRFYSFGTNTSTRGGFKLIGIHSDQGNATTFLDINSSGYVGFNTSSQQAAFSIGTPTAITSFPTYSTNDLASIGWNYFALGDELYVRSMDIVSKGAPDGTNGGSIIRFLTTPFTNGSAAIERMRISPSGNVGIATINPLALLDICLLSSGARRLLVNYADSIVTVKSANDSNSAENLRLVGDNIIFNSSSSGNGTERMRILSGGNILIGTTTDSGSKLAIGGGLELQQGANRRFRMGSGTNYYYDIRTDNDDFAITEAGSTDRLRYSYSNTRWNITGGLAVSGSLSKGSGSFKIDHPLESMSETHYLVHSFVESPQANNIYRGKIQLKNGIAEVNLDEVSTMTEGTFVALNREIHTYTSNETDWDAVKGKVVKNVLHIECQNNQSNAIVSWLVIGERQDKHIMDTDWTDKNGKVIVEPLK